MSVVVIAAASLTFHSRPTFFLVKTTLNGAACWFGRFAWNGVGQGAAHDGGKPFHGRITIAPLAAMLGRDQPHRATRVEPTGQPLQHPLAVRRSQ